MTLVCPPDLTAIINPFVARGKRRQAPWHYVSPEAFRSLTVASRLPRWRGMAVASDNDLNNRLLAYSRDEFKEWLDRIDRGGSITG